MLLKKLKAFSLIEISIVILVIGILIAGISKGSNIYYNMKHVAAKSLTTNSIVNNIPDLHLWYETTLDGSFDKKYADGELVEKWNNININDDQYFDLYQADNTYKPKYIKRGINDLPSLYFDYSFLANEVSLNANYSIFAVFYRDENGPNEDTILAYNGGIHLEIRSENDYLRMLHRSPIGSSGGNNNYSSEALDVKKNYIISYIRNFNIDSPYIKLWANDRDISPTSPIVTLGDFNVDLIKFYVGAAYDNGGRPFVGKINELIVFDRALEQDEIDKVENYLSKKWAIDLE